jgi:hypothetical protein
LGVGEDEYMNEKARARLLPVLVVVFPDRELNANDIGALYTFMETFEERDLSKDERQQLRDIIGYTPEEYQVLMSMVALGHYENEIEIDFVADPVGTRTRILEYASAKGWL